jgi:hypothetical protein
MCKVGDVFGLLGGGPSDEEKALQAADASLSRTLESHYNTAFADQQDSLKMLKSTISRIQSGQTGPGFSADELAARTSEIVNQSGANARNVEQVLADQSAGQIFDGKSDASGLARASAVRQQLNEEALSHSETQKSNALLNLKAADYAQGRINTDKTAAGLEALSGQYGGIANASLSGRESMGKQAYGEAHQINEENQQVAAMIGGLIKAGVGIGGSFLTGGMTGLAGTGGENFLQKTGDFFKGGMDSLTSGNG